MTSPWPTPNPAGHTMCCLCFDVFTLAQLHVLPDGTREDVCEPCAAREADAKRPPP